MWLAPRLPRLLQRSQGYVEMLEYRELEAREAREAEYERVSMILGELQEAAALADGAPWNAPRGRLRESQSPAAAGLLRAREAIMGKAKEAVDNLPARSTQLRETIYGMAELEIALEDRGWKRLIAQSHYEFSRFGIQSIMLICRLYYIKNPLARRGVNVSAFYVFGRGIEISSPDEAANETLQEFFLDPRNASQFSHSALTKKEAQTHHDGNIFLAFFPEEQTGRLECRSIDPIEVSDIITDPEDAEQPWFYRRDWTQYDLDLQNGQTNPKTRSAWYVVMGYEDLPNFPTQLKKLQGYPVMMDSHGQPVCVMHIKDGELPGWKFGCPRMYPALDWIRAYRQGLEDLCTTWRALARFAWNVETKGGAPAIAAFKQSLATTLANDLSQIETNPPPITGSAFISSPSNKISPMNTSNVTMSPDNLRRVLLMVCAAFGIGEHLFGDATTGSLATAASLERPAELMFLERQEVWREVISRIGRYVLTRSIKAPKGKLREAIAKRKGISTSEVDAESVLIESAPSNRHQGLVVKVKAKEGTVSKTAKSSGAGQPDESNQTDIAEAGPAKTPEKITISVKFPDILTHDIASMVGAIVEAMTLKGFEPNGIDERVGMTLLLSELGVEDPSVVIEAMFPEDTYNADRTLEPESPTKVTATVVAPAAPDSNADDTAPTVPPAAADADQPPPKKKGKVKEAAATQEQVDRAVEQLLRAAKANLERLKNSKAAA